MHHLLAAFRPKHARYLLVAATKLSHQQNKEIHAENIKCFEKCAEILERVKASADAVPTVSMPQPHAKRKREESEAAEDECDVQMTDLDGAQQLERSDDSKWEQEFEELLKDCL
eukprot:c4255_g1_i3.p2 GENE.c4255_g1_i3~~c4255_g1_i3.p2  ORF type:complete len:114 (+),score=28.88 c4255_g1_i3:521-862(+)